MFQHHQHQAQLSQYSSGGNLGDIDGHDQPQPISVKTTELAKKSLEDTADVNVTNTSAAMFGDQSHHVIQRPLPVNRIQQKITKDMTYGMDKQ